MPVIFLAEGLDVQHAMSSPYSFILSSRFGYEESISVCLKVKILDSAVLYAKPSEGVLQIA